MAGFTVYEHRSLDKEDVLLLIEQLSRPYDAGLADNQTPRTLADRYVRTEAPGKFNFDLWVDPVVGFPIPLPLSPDQTVGPENPAENETRLRFGSQVELDGMIQVNYVQTFYNIPIWQAGFCVMVNGLDPDHLRVTSAINTLQRVDGILVAHYNAADPFLPDKIDIPALATLLGYGGPPPTLRINRKRKLIYRYTGAERADSVLASLAANPADAMAARELPSMKLPNLPPDLANPGISLIRELNHYIVTEVLFTLSTKGFPDTNWRALIDVRTGAVLYVRPFVAEACRDRKRRRSTGGGATNGSGDAPPAFKNAAAMVYAADPLTMAGTDPTTIANPKNRTARLDALRTTVGLRLDVTDSSPGKYSLAGEFVRISDENPPDGNVPEKEIGAPFAYQVWDDRKPDEAEGFSAANAYYHPDSLFRLMRGFVIEPVDYFGPDGWPIPIDPSGTEGAPDGCTYGDANGSGVEKIVFGPLRNPIRAGVDFPISNAVDPRVVMHEFCHALLFARIHSPNFGFAHSAGDSLAAILTDPGSQAPDRYNTFPWLTPVNPRRHDRPLSDPASQFHGDPDGWAWRGPRDQWDTSFNTRYPGYLREQILSTTLFRIYKAIGGTEDPGASAKFRVANGLNSSLAEAMEAVVAQQKIAARYMAFLIIKAISLLSPFEQVPCAYPILFCKALMEADTSTVVFSNPLLDTDPSSTPFPNPLGIPFAGGAVHKVIRWGFQLQGLYQKNSGDPDSTEGTLALGAPFNYLPGDPPPVDAYIYDGRADALGNPTPGDYTWHDDFANAPHVWNRYHDYSNPQDPMINPVTDHQNPIIGVPNFIYVKVGSAGYNNATHVRARSYAHLFEDTQLWDGTWTELSPTSTPPGSISIAPGKFYVFGPFQWIPSGHAGDKRPVIASVSATDDPSNIDPDAYAPAPPLACAHGHIPLDRLVPFDNNIALRVMTLA